MKRAYWISLGTLGGLFTIAFGCGGVGDAGGLFSGGSEGTGGTATTTSNVASTSGSLATGSSSSGMNTSSSGSGTSSASSSASSSSSAVSSSSSGGGPTVPCGPMMCPTSNMGACCWDRFQMTTTCVMGDPMNDNCTTEPVAGGFETRIECHGPADCPNAVCCGDLHQTGMSYYSTVMCAPTCINGDRQLCDPNGAPCPFNGNCQQSQYLPPGYFVCN